MSNRIIQLDALRGVAVLMVLGFHYTTRYQQLYGHPNKLPFEVSAGYLGVQLFFVISGFVIFMTLERTLDYKDFLVARFARLYPAYWCGVIITYVVILIFKLPGRETTLLEGIVNLSMLQEFFRVPHVDGVYWTLTLELVFYAIMLALFKLKYLKQVERVAVGWLCLVLIAYAAVHIFALRISGMIQTAFMLEYANLFVAGIMFYRLMYSGNARQTHLIIFAALGIEYIIHGLQSGLVCSIFILVFYAIVYKLRAVYMILSARPLVFIGTISYSLYLIHQNIGYVILRELYAKGLTPPSAISVTIITSLFLATCINLTIETRARKAIRDYWKNWFMLRTSAKLAQIG